MIRKESWILDHFEIFVNNMLDGDLRSPSVFLVCTLFSCITVCIILDKVKVKSTSVSLTDNHMYIAILFAQQIINVNMTLHSQKRRLKLHAFSVQSAPGLIITAV